MGKKAETAIIYCRTSTRGQREEKTIDAQIAWAQEAVKRDGVRLLPWGPKRDGWVKDDGVSGSLLEGREFAKLIDAIERGEVRPDYVYAYSLSRLAREDRSSRNRAKRIRSRTDASRIAAVLGAYDIQIRDESGTNDPNSIGYDVKQSVSVQQYADIRKNTINGKAPGSRRTLAPEPPVSTACRGARFEVSSTRLADAVRFGAVRFPLRPAPQGECAAPD